MARVNELEAKNLHLCHLISLKDKEIQKLSKGSCELEQILIEKDVKD